MLTKKIYGDQDHGGSRITNLGDAINPTDAVTLQQLENTISTQGMIEDVDNIQTDATLVPERVIGKRYIVLDKDNLHVDFGDIVGLDNGDIVQFDAGEFQIATDVSETTNDILITYVGGVDKFYECTDGIWMYSEGLNAIEFKYGFYQSEQKDSVSIDVNVVAERAIFSIGNGAANNFTLTHNLNKPIVNVTAIDVLSGYSVELCWKINDANKIDIEFTTVNTPTLNQYAILIVG